MPSSGMIRKCSCEAHWLSVLVWALTLVGVCGAVVVVSWKRTTGSVAITSMSPGPAPVPSRDASDDFASQAASRNNPAAQRAGPPDPEAERSATTAAQDAARAAANLAAKAGGLNP